MDDSKRSLAPGWDHPPRLLTRHGLLPLHSVPTQEPVPAWEKQFVTDVCGIPWKRLLEAKKLKSVYKSIVDWDDSGARVNFENEKSRFWAKLNGLRCEIQSPAPDLYLDKIDYYQEIDSKLMADLEKPPPPPQPQQTDTSSHGWDSYFLADRVPVTGWVDFKDPVQSYSETPVDKRIVPTGWVNEGYPSPHTGFVVSGFSAVDRDANNGLIDAGRNYTRGWEQKNSGDSYIAAWHSNNLLGGGQDWFNGRKDSWAFSQNNHCAGRNFNDVKIDGSQYGKRWTRSRHPGDNYHVSLVRRNGREGSVMGYGYDNQLLTMR